MAGALHDVARFSDRALADAMRKQLRFDVLAGQQIPAQQQLIVEALARILERGAHPAPGQMLKPVGHSHHSIVEGKS